MCRQAIIKLLGLIVVFTVALFFSACATNSHSGGFGSGSGSGSGGSGSTGGSGGSGGSGGASGPTTGNFAAGIGGAGQTTSAHFLTAVQIPGAMPVATKINSNGTLTPTKVNFTQVSGNPMAMNAAIDPSGSFVYEAVRGGGLWGFTINRQSGDLTVMPNAPVAGSQDFDAVAIDQLGKFVYAYGGGQVFAYTLQPGTGQLSPIAGSPFGAAPSGQQFAVPSDRIAVSQNDKFLYVATANGITGYTIDPTTGALTMIAGSPFAGNVPGFAVVAPASGFLYETAASTATTSTGIYGYSIDPNTGALAAINGSPFGPGCGADNMTSPANGKFLFAAGCGMYQINASTGALTHLFNDPSTPNSAWAVFDPAGAFVWMVTTDQNCWHCNIGVTAFQVDPNTGNMTMVPNSFLVMQNDNTGGIVALAITH
jgi:6-phosphogluconolactonase